MPYILAFVLLFLSACSSKSYTVNGVVCPSTHSEQQVQNDLKACRYYDEKAIAEAHKSPIQPECIECLEKRGYSLQK